MQNQTAPTGKQGELLVYLAYLTGFFLLLEISFFIQSNKSYLFVFNFVSDRLAIPLTIVPGVIYFIAIQLLVHSLYCLLVWIVTVSAANMLKLPEDKRLRFGIGIWLLGLVTILIANQYFFPNSKFAGLTALIFTNRQLLKAVFILLVTCCYFLIILAVLRRWWLLFVVITTVANFTFFKSHPSIVQDGATPEWPNIIFVGVDSLRPDFLSYFGREQSTPFFDTFLSQATVFTEAVTPLARTFPSWTSILSGDYPKQTGARFNLPQPQRLHLSDSLPAILHRQGYETIFATDETRFSNIDTYFGFDQVVTPPMGLNDFLLGSFNDFPLSNLIVNTPIGKWFFPHSYGNRPVEFTYEPDSFLKLIQPVLHTSRTKPLFLAIHFCLPHTPYVWAGLPAQGLTGVERYQASILRVDEQVNDFFRLLKQNHLLDHAIVVLLSDHGEALEFAGDRITEKESFVPAKHNKNIPLPAFYPPGLDDEQVDQSVGHGTDVLGLSQYHTLLAFRLYGLGPQRTDAIPGVVSLIDIKPTVLDLINVPRDKKLTSLAPLIKGQSVALPLHHLFLESDFSPAAIRTIYPKVKEAILEGVDLFQIDPSTTRLMVKDSMAEMSINSKQYADIYGDWMLALYPQSKNVRMPILVNLVTGDWTNDLNSVFAQQSPALIMLNALKDFYGEELTGTLV
ncbi:MAG: DUF229 domain-containing protein [Gammaproteobacteria bacterium]|nr:MAG: DUF229 domain-containing protein [Gammaproteobacteria bacterium]